MFFCPNNKKNCFQIVFRTRPIIWLKPGRFVTNSVFFFALKAIIQNPSFFWYVFARGMIFIDLEDAFFVIKSHFFSLSQKSYPYKEGNQWYEYIVSKQHVPDGLIWLKPSLFKTAVLNRMVLCVCKNHSLRTHKAVWLSGLKALIQAKITFFGGSFHPKPTSLNKNGGSTVLLFPANTLLSVGVCLFCLYFIWSEG